MEDRTALLPVLVLQPILPDATTDRGQCRTWRGRGVRRWTRLPVTTVAAFEPRRAKWQRRRRTSASRTRALNLALVALPVDFSIPCSVSWR